jgi:hypothetical protein
LNADAGAMNEDIEPAEMLDRLTNHFPDTRFYCDVDVDCVPSHRVLAAVRYIGDHYPAAFFHRTFSDCQSYSAGAAGD